MNVLNGALPASYTSGKVTTRHRHKIETHLHPLDLFLLPCIH